MIKKAIYSFALSFLCVLTIHGQDKFVPEWNVGVGFGPTFSSVDFLTQTSNVKVNTKSWSQFQGGVAVRYMSEKHLGIIGELNYSQQGWEEEHKDNPEYASTHQLNYIDMPILTHIYFGNKVRFIFNIGPKISFLLSEKETTSQALINDMANGNISGSFPTHQYFRDVDTRFDYGLIGGMGLELSTGIGSFALEGRYYFGLGDVYKNSKADYFSRSANKVMSVKLTYYVKLF